MRRKPLQDIRVLDLTRLLPGPLCARHLADMGADVIKIEDTGAGDYARSMGPVKVANTPFFLMLNRNKRALRLDLKKPDGREVLLRLADHADVLVEGFRPGVMDRLELGYGAIRKRNPSIVYCAITGYGQTGPYRMRAGHDLNYCAYAGILDQMGGESGQPAMSNFQIGDLAGGTLSAAMGILAALVDARQSGKGRMVDVSMTDCAMAHNIFPLAAIAANGKAPPRGRDLLTGAVPCYNIYPTMDGGYMAVGALEAKFWRQVCKVLNRPDLADTGMAQGVEGERTKKALREIFRTRTRDDWAAIFDSADCCVSPVLSVDEARTDSQIRARGVIQEFEHPVDGESLLYDFPVRFSEDPAPDHRPAPMPGEHTAEILGEAGFTDEEIARLRNQGTI